MTNDFIYSQMIETKCRSFGSTGIFYGINGTREKFHIDERTGKMNLKKERLSLNEIM